MEIENLYCELSVKKNHKNRDFQLWNDIDGQYDPFVCTCNRQGFMWKVACTMQPGLKSGLRHWERTK